MKVRQNGQSRRPRRRGLLAGAAAACALAGAIAATGSATAATGQPSLRCANEQAATSAYKTWQTRLIGSPAADQGRSRARSGPGAAVSSQPEWLATFGSMITRSQNSRDAGQNWFTWDNPSGKTYVRQAFATPSSYIMGASQDQVSSSGVEAGWPALPVTVQRYWNAWDLISALDPDAFGGQPCGSGLYSGVGAVMYDDEDWSSTPRSEQQYPGYYVAMIAYYVHQHNVRHPAQPLRFFVAPSLDLSNVVAGAHNTGSTAWNYLADFIPELVSVPSVTWNPGQGSATGTEGNFGSYVADDVDVQAQQDEPVVTGTVTPTHVTYQYLVRRAASQIAAGDPGATVFAGLTTNNTGSDGAQATMAQLLTAAAAVQGTVSGFWLNDPGQSSACPKCTGTYPDIADRSLNAIDSSPGW